MTAKHSTKPRTRPTRRPKATMRKPKAQHNNRKQKEPTKTMHPTKSDIQNLTLNITPIKEFS